MRPCSFMRSCKYQFFNFLLYLKTAFTKHVHICIHQFLCSFTSVKFRMFFYQDRNSIKFRMLFTKMEFFSRIRSMLNLNLIRAKKVFSQLCYRDCHQGSRRKASAVSQNYCYFCHNTWLDTTFRNFFEFETKLP